MKWHPSDISEACVLRNSAGFQYEEFSCLYPTLGRTYARWEQDYDPVPIRDWMIRSPYVPILACLTYGAWIVGGQEYFRTRPAWNCRPLLAVWNLSLAIFSIMGFLRVAPHLWHNYTTYTWEENFCMDPESSYGSGTTGVWVQLFILSKIPELFDTFFIVVHKKPLIFLHWYHHVSVLIYCWHSYVTKAPVGIIFCCMNYGVHGIMYFYYFLMAIHAKPKFVKAMWITVAQISQMIVGVIVTLLGAYLSRDPPPSCTFTKENNWAALIMYGSYLALFLEFFWQRYRGRTKSAPSRTLRNGKVTIVRNGTKRKES